MATHTPGPWVWHTSNSWRRLKHETYGLSISVLEPFVARDGHPDLTVSPGNMALIAAAPDLAQSAGNVLAYEHAALAALEGRPETRDGLKRAFDALNAALLSARGEA